jgi:hypothetical protein
LQVEIGGNTALDLEQRVHGEKPVIADVDVGPYGQESLRDSEVAVAQRSLDDRLVREERLELPPECNAFEQRAGLVETWQSQ